MPLALLLLLSFSALGEPIHRDRAEVAAFRKANPCPSTGMTRGPCAGHQIDHTRSLCSGGEDRRENMAWLRTEDHAFKTRIDVRECRKLRQMANEPAR